MDTVTAEKRSAIMRTVKAENTKPEIAVRKLAHRLGYRFRLHRKDLPGKPDLVFPKYKTALFVHGCFWHWHGCKRSRMPATNTEYWEQKINKNMKRDQRVRRQLRKIGWRTLVVWECQIGESEKIARRLQHALDHD